MLSRRHLRIKVFHGLYALQVAREANYELAVDFITDAFKPNLNSMEPQDLEQLESLRKTATTLLEKNYRSGQIDKDDQTHSHAFVAAKNALTQYLQRTKEDSERICRKMPAEIDGVYDTYLFILQLFVEMGVLSKNERDRQYEDPDGPKLSRIAGFDTNQIIQALTNHKALQTEIIRRGASWNDAQSTFVRKLFRDIFRNDETYQTYCAKFPHTPAEDQELVSYALKNVIFKHEDCLTFLEQNDLYWNETSDIVRKMATKTLKSTQEPEGTELSPLTDSWDEDQFFMEELFKQTLHNEQQYEEFIAEPLKNWDADRLASTDYLILKMALAEMMNFSGIPVKVTINEAIELAKEYSTPKSGKFVNGILDTLSKSLINDGKIRKSGRGLLDNK